MEFLGSLISIWSIFMQLFLLSSASTSPRGNEVDRISLLAFKAEMNDSLGILSSWNELVPTLLSVIGHQHKRVTVLDLQSRQLKGHLSPHIGNLSFLRTLNLQNNSFSSNIPQEIGHLFRLRKLDLGNSFFSGDIPVNISLFSSLQYLGLVLNLRKNNLVGEIPPSVGNPSSILRLSLDQNNLHGGGYLSK
ncbi:PREDICTED: probable LRR receptor [Prunus dulcis]|uniref:PREDICTED: probable LRR receptor n=1 Tax=Prunus dulcis TaxID=3755 RepID=A0A5E4EA58_PRUDU|nr:PREDICTED: probable LRR receptor [Prunus dulcis]